MLAVRHLPVAGMLLAGLATACAAAPVADEAATTVADATPTVGADDGVSTPDVPPLHPSVDDWPTATIELVGDDGTAHRVDALVATTSAQRQHGLMEVPELPTGVGMWFVYDEVRTGGFWMKDTRVPLDIAYVGADQRIVSIADATPCTADPCPTYPPAGPYQHVLEVAAGSLERLDVGVGDLVRRVPD